MLDINVLFTPPCQNDKANVKNVYDQGQQIPSTHRNDALFTMTMIFQIFRNKKIEVKT